MSYLIDITVISELTRAEPDPGVISWFSSVPDSALHLSVLTLGELRKGVEKQPDADRREKLRLWLEHDLPVWFGDNLLPVDAAITHRWGCLLAEITHPLPTLSRLLGATALQHNLRIVTRNIDDFDLPGLTIINPWSN